MKVWVNLGEEESTSGELKSKVNIIYDEKYGQALACAELNRHYYERQREPEEWERRQREQENRLQAIQKKEQEQKNRELKLKQAAKSLEEGIRAFENGQGSRCKHCHRDLYYVRCTDWRCGRLLLFGPLMKHLYQLLNHKDTSTTSSTKKRNAKPVIVGGQKDK
jgi:hypothetical protein